jgi:hypothetical protein
MVNRSDFRFFSKHAGGWVGHNAITAFSLAKAEQYAEDMGWQYTWEWDECCSYDEGRQMECLTLSDADGNVLQCLGGIDAAFDKHARRVFEAELASEAMACLPAATFGIGKAA